MATLLLDQVTWDLVVDADNNIAVADDPYALAQDAASAIRTYLGECYWDTSIGVPYLQQIFGKRLSVALLIQQLSEAAKTVPGVTSANVFLYGLNRRTVSGQVQVKSAATGVISAANFTVINPQVA